LAREIQIRSVCQLIRSELIQIPLVIVGIKKFLEFVEQMNEFSLKPGVFAMICLRSDIALNILDIIERQFQANPFFVRLNLFCKMGIVECLFPNQVTFPQRQTNGKFCSVWYFLSYHHLCSGIGSGLALCNFYQRSQGIAHYFAQFSSLRPSMRSNSLLLLLTSIMSLDRAKPAISRS